MFVCATNLCQLEESLIEVIQHGEEQRQALLTCLAQQLGPCARWEWLAHRDLEFARTDNDGNSRG